MFKLIVEGFKIEAASFGERNSRVLVFRVAGGDDIWEQVTGKRVLLIGGAVARREIKRLLSDYGRPSLQNRIPGGISGSVHTALREYVGL